MPANWVLLAIPLGLLCLFYLAWSAVQTRRERSYLHAVFDGDRIQAWKTDRYNSKHSAIRMGRRFY